MMWLWLACGKEPAKDTSPGPTGPTGSTGETATTDTGTRPGPDLFGAPPNNYTLSPTFTVSQQEVRAAYDGLLLRWSTLATDAWGDPIDASSVPRLLLLEITVPPSEVAERLARDDLGFDLLSTWEADIAGRVFLDAEDLTAGKTPFDPSAFLVEDPSRSWVMALGRPVGPRTELLAATVLVPSAGSTNTAAVLDDTTSSFQWSAALDGEVLVTANEWDAWTLDWSGLDVDAFGRPFDDRRIDQLFVAKFDDPPSALGASMRDLSAAATAEWTMDVASFTDARLELARDASNNPFPGFEAGPTWVVGGRCSTCFTPFPAYTFVVEVR